MQQRSSRFLSRFARVTTSGRYIPVIDGLRFVSIMLVIGFHVRLFFLNYSPLAQQVFAGHSSAILNVASIGFFGVQIFFVISGFILGLPFVLSARPGGKPVSLRAYYLRRLTRLEPPYIVALTFMLVLALTTTAYPAGLLFEHYVARLFYVNDFVFGVSLLSDVLWSLAIEVQFYLLVPVFARIFRLRRPLIRRAVIVAVILVFSQINKVADGILIFNYLQYFFVGFLLADFYVVDWQLDPPRRPLWDGVGVLGWGLLIVLLFFRDLNSPLVQAALRFAVILALLAIFMAAFRGVLWGKLLSLRLITVIGGMCYTIYLYHYNVIFAFGHLTVNWTVADSPTLTFLLQLLLMLAPILLISGVLFLLIERPCMDRTWLPRLIASLRAKPHPLPAAPPPEV